MTRLVAQSAHDGQAGLLAVYDSTDAKRIDGTHYTADRLSLG